MSFSCLARSLSPLPTFSFHVPFSASVLYVADCFAYVRSYIVSAIQKELTLPYDLARLKDMIRSDVGSWSRHREWMYRLSNDVEKSEDANMVDSRGEDGTANV